MSKEPDNALNQCLRSVWQRSQQKHIAGGLLAFARWFVPLFLLVVVIDRFIDLPDWLRGGSSILLIVAVLHKSWNLGWRQLRRFNSNHVCRQIERSYKGVDGLFVTATQFRQKGPESGTSKALWEHTQQQAEEAAATVLPKQVVSFQDHKKPLQIALCALLVISGAFLVNGPFMAAGFGRLFTPWRDIVYPTNTQIELPANDFVVKEGAAANLEFRLSGVIPNTAKLAIQTGEGRPLQLNLDVIDQKCVYEIAAASRDFAYRIKAGDARSKWGQVRVITAPRVEKVRVELEFPEYTDKPQETVEALTLTVPEGTKIRQVITLDTPIRQATLHRDGLEDLPLEIGEDHRTLRITESADASRGYSFSWVERNHDFDFTSPRYFLQVASDQPPRIELTSPESNLDAMLGRPLELAVRASDDHGIGSTTITYRINRRPPKTIALEQSLQNGGGEQSLDWDYRKELPDLKVGDTVSFVAEVADKYPGEIGPQTARSEARRITFLSREEYLAAITKQMERLLTRVRTLYRQERSAHKLVLALNPSEDSYIPTCQLEAIRQEMLREQLVATADAVQALLDDLAANQVSDAVESDVLSSLQHSLRSIAEDHVARSANLLREQVGAKSYNPVPASSAVNQAARELAELVMQRGIDASREVFARETQMLARELARLRLLLIKSSAKDAELVAEGLLNVATWTQDLLVQLETHMSYDKKALLVLGLKRRIHGLQTGGLSDSIRGVAKLAREGDLSEAGSSLYPLILPLLESEFTMRVGSQFAQMKALREQVSSVIVGQKSLIKEAVEEEDLELLVRVQAKLRDQLVLSQLQYIPAPRATIFDLELMPVPPADELRLDAEASMTMALKSLQSDLKGDAVKYQRQALSALENFSSILEDYSVELAQMSLGVSASVSDASDRLGVCELLEANQVSLIEQTEEAALDEKNPPSLLDDQHSLLKEVQGFRKEIIGVEGKTPKGLLALVSRLDVVAQAMEDSVNTIKSGSPEEALDPQEMAADALADARIITEQQLAQYNLLNNLISFEQSVHKATMGMADVVGGQNDLIAVTKMADEKELQALLKPQSNLLTCLSDIAPSLDLVASRLDVGTPLVFAASDVEDAIFAMEDGDSEDAAEIQEIAVDSLTKVQGLIGEIAVQTAYISEIVDFLHTAQSDASYMAFQQRELREKKNEDLLAKQNALASEAEAYGKILNEVAGNVDFEKLDAKAKLKFENLDFSMNFQTPSSAMKEIISLLMAGQDASDAMLTAENALRNNSQQMTVIIEMLSGLPNQVLNNASSPELFRLIDILDVAAKQRQLLRETSSDIDKDLAVLSARQAKITEKLGQFNSGEKSDPSLTPIHAEMQPIAGLITANNRIDATLAQKSADLDLRHYIIQWALILNTFIPPGSSSDSDVVTEGETTDLYETDTAGFVADFVAGEGPKDKKSEWEILGERNRAALNQNFARELPLEYRATLKDYYERVAK